MKKTLIRLITLFSLMGGTLLGCSKNKVNEIQPRYEGEESIEDLESPEKEPVYDIGQTRNIDGFLYRLVDEKYEILSYDGKDPTPTIPDVVEEIEVNKIAPYAFIHNDLITKVTMGANITSIGDYAFYDCSRLEEVTFGSSSKVTSIGRGVFGKDILIESISLPNSLTTLGQGAFFECLSLTSIAIPNKVTEIAPHLFYNCISLESVTTGNNVTEYGQYAFYNNFALLGITLSSKTEVVGDYCFANCTSLTEMSFPAQMEIMGGNVLSGCYSLEELTLPFVGTSKYNYSRYPLGYLFGTDEYENSYSATQHFIAQYVDYDTFEVLYNYLEDETYYLPISLVKVSMNNGNATFGAFENCVSLVEVNLYNGSNIIEDYAFKGCSSLLRLIVPRSVSRIEGNPFNGCDPEIFIFLYNSSYVYPSLKWRLDLTNVFFDYTGNNITYTFMDGLQEIGTIEYTVDIVFPTFEKPGHSFNGWYSESLDFHNEGDRYYSPENIVFYADTTPLTFNVITPLPGGDSHIVFFYGTTYAEEYLGYQVVDTETSLFYPLPDYRSDAVFTGWYRYDEYVTPYDFSQTVTDPFLNLYAHWVSLPSDVTALPVVDCDIELKDAPVETSNDYVDYYFAFSSLTTVYTTLTVSADVDTIPPLLEITTNYDDLGNIAVIADAVGLYLYRDNVYYMKVTVHKDATMLSFVWGEGTIPLAGGYGQAGTGLLEQPVTYNTTYHLQLPDHVPGYEYLGYYLLDNPSVMLTDGYGNSIRPWFYLTDVVVGLKMEAITYTINYHLSEIDVDYEVVSGEIVTSYTVETSTIVLPVLADKDGLKSFVGWFDNPGFSGTPVTDIPFGSYGDIDLYPYFA